MTDFEKEYSEIELTENHFNKLLVNKIKGGDKIAIYWSDRELPDYGYIFKLPSQDRDDIFDSCIHVTHVDNSDGMDNGDEQWIHLGVLLTYERLEQITLH